MLSRTWVRIALSYIALVLTTVGILAVLLGDEFATREAEALRARLSDQARAVAFAAAPLLAPATPISVTNTLAHRMAGLFGTRVTLIRPDGQVVGDSEEDPALMANHGQRPEVVQALAHPGAPGSDTRLSATVHRQLLYVAVTVPAAQEAPAAPGPVAGVARVAYPLTSVEQARATLWRNLALTVLLVSLPAALLGTLLARSIAGPLSALRGVAARFGQGDLTARADSRTGGEIGALSGAFNAKANRLSDTIRRRTTERNQMAAVLAHMHDGIVLTDAHGAIDGINPTACRLLGTTPEYAMGRSLVALTQSHEMYQAGRAALAAPGERQYLELTLGPYQVACVVTGIPGPAGAPPTGLAVLQDVTEVRRLERVRRDFVANIGHELRTPLASIKLLVETLHTAIHDDPEAATDFLRRIDVELDGLTQLVRELLELSRIESGQVQLDRRPVPVDTLLERAAGRLRAQAERAGLTLTVRLAPALPPADVDAARIEQVLVNLVHNAIKFTPPGGEVTLGAAPDPAGVRLYVRDTGIGIAPAEQPRLFERFYKVDKARAAGAMSAGGTGLGLAIAKHLVQAHGGEIGVTSRPGAGATFAFTLPVVAASRAVVPG
jgi:two-component system phosphate regulon sensor histidine kinase PhoR